MASQSNAERFVGAFAAIEKALNAITRRPRYIPFRMNARISARYNSVVKNHLEEICTFAELRNCIVHNRDGHLEVIAEPSDDTTANIEHIAELLQRDHNVLSFATAPVITADSSETLKAALVRMDECGIHSLPVYSEGKFKGMFTLQQVLHYLLNHQTETELVDNILTESMKDRVMFVDKKTSLETVVKLFDEFASMNLRQPAIIVTETGDHAEAPLGIITHHDLVRITTFLA